MVALTAGAVACAPEGDAGGFLQGGPPTGILLNPSSIVWLDTQKKNKCYDSKNNVENPHDSLGGEANRLGDVIDSICG